ncbi:MAG: mechanosensitive ion channel family protein [Ktedonobacteraceae bacterium]
MTVFQNFGQAILSALGHALDVLLVFIPLLLGFLVILLVGYIIASVVSKAVVFLLRKIGFDRLAQRVGLTRMEQRMGVKLDPAGVLGKIVFWFLFLIFLVPATNALGLTSVSGILNTLIAYIPNVFVAILVLFLGTLGATFVADIVRGATSSTNIGNPNIFANIARWAIIGFAALIALEQLQIAPALINELFAAIVGGAAIAFGLAFGLGGQDSARRWLSRGESTVSSAASQIQAQQAQQNMHQANANPQYQTGQVPTQQAGTAYPQQPAYPQAQQPYTDSTSTMQNPYNRPPTH